MNRTVLKIFCYFVFTAVTISLILLIINFLGLVFIGSDKGNIYTNSPRYVLNEVSGNIEKGDNGFYIRDKNIIPKGSRCILLDDNGDIIWQHNKPEDIPSHYSIKDIARITRWFLNDYPIYVQAEDYGLLIYGSPKNSVGKYNIEYSMNWFESLPKRIIYVLLINICLAAILACLFGIRLYKRLKMLINGIKDLRQEKSVYLREKGIFKELCKSINETALTIERKNTALAVRDKARTNWISGISHDIRTPLSVAMGYSEALESCDNLSNENRKKAGIITSQIIKIKKLIEDLNLISSLEYDMQPSKKKAVRLCPLLRRVTSDIMNSEISEKFEVELDLRSEKAVIYADEALIERAVFNLINNSIIHNKEGCNIKIYEYTSRDTVFIRISDDGSGVSDNVIRNISEIPKSAHGMGLPMAYKIITVHGGKFIAENKGGFVVNIELPLKC